MAEEKDHSFRGLPHVKMIDLVGAPSKIEKAAKEAGHTGSLATPVDTPPEKKVEATVEKKNPVTPPQKPGVRGRVFLFQPTGERVTVVREKVGNAYSGHWIHEVIARDGKKFLASTGQLVEIV